jgi:hypothetical protein
VRRETLDRVGLFLPWDRAADSEWLHRALSEMPSLRVEYRGDAVVRHLEIRSADDWFKKIETYGESNRPLERLWNYRPLGWSDKLKIAGRAFGRLERPGAEALGFFWTLAAGDFRHRCGRGRRTIHAS